MINEMKKYLDYCKYRKELDEKTIKAYRIDLKQYFDFTKENYDNKEINEEYLTSLHKKYKQKTIKRKIASIKAFFNYLEQNDIISDNPFRKINVKFKESIILPKIIPRHEIEQLLNYMYSCSVSAKTVLRDLAVVEMCFATGARVSEISNMRLENIDLETGLIRLNGKGKKERFVQIISLPVLELLKEYYIENKISIDSCGYFFINNRGRRFSEQSIRLMIKKYVSLAGIRRNITPHMFRHSFATYLIEDGVDVTYVQRILGHSSIRTTQIYIHIAMKQQTEILKRCHPRIKMKIRELVA